MTISSTLADDAASGPVHDAAPTPMTYVLLLLPFAGLLAVPLYDRLEPALFGIPFFYWYQFAWVPVTSLLIYLAHRRRP